MARGSVKKYTAKDGAVSYRVIYDLAPDPVTGKRRQKRETYRTKKEAESALRHVLDGNRKDALLAFVEARMGGLTDHDLRKLSDMLRLEARRRAGEWVRLREFVFHRDGYACRYCGGASGNLHLDHLIPRTRGGANTPDNLVTACSVCNSSKSDMTPDEWLGSGSPAAQPFLERVRSARSKRLTPSIRSVPHLLESLS